LVALDLVVVRHPPVWDIEPLRVDLAATRCRLPQRELKRRAGRLVVEVFEQVIEVIIQRIPEEARLE
jgi:hypothetical protein